MAQSHKDILDPWTPAPRVPIARMVCLWEYFTWAQLVKFQPWLGSYAQTGSYRVKNWNSLNLSRASPAWRVLKMHRAKLGSPDSIYVSAAIQWYFCQAVMVVFVKRFYFSAEIQASFLNSKQCLLRKIIFKYYLISIVSAGPPVRRSAFLVPFPESKLKSVRRSVSEISMKKFHIFCCTWIIFECSLFHYHDLLKLIYSCR